MLFPSKGRGKYFDRTNLWYRMASLRKVMFVQVQFNTCCRIVSFHLTSCSKVEKLSCARIKQTTAPLLFPVFNVYWLLNKTQVITQNTQLHNTLKTWKTQIVSKIDVSQPEGCSLQRVRTRGAGATL